MSTGTDATTIENPLPGRAVPYRLEAGTGQAYILGGQVNRFLTTCAETDGALAIANNLGPAGVNVPPHYHDLQHDMFYCVRGALQVWANDQSWIAHAGDFVSLPPKTAHSFTILSHYTELLAPVVPCGWPRFFEIMGRRYGDGPYPEVDSSPPPAPEQLGQVEAEELSFPVFDFDFSAPDLDAAGDQLPADERPYLLRAGEGPRHQLFGQVCFQLVTGAQSRGRIGYTITEGPLGSLVPAHVHEHTHEAVFCLAGQMRVWTDGEEHRLIPGDFVSIPKTVEHRVALDAHFTRFASIVSPAGPELLYEVAGTAAEHQIFPAPALPGSVDKEQLTSASSELDITFTD